MTTPHSGAAGRKHINRLRVSLVAGALGAGCAMVALTVGSDPVDVNGVHSVVADPGTGRATAPQTAFQVGPTMKAPPFYGQGWPGGGPFRGGGWTGP
jgi:hypothetical protein